MGCAHLIDPSDPKQETMERSLLPAVFPAGMPFPSWSLEERMARYRVPGVSIALIDEGKIAWAKGYGVTQANGTDAVSPSTLFQAASIAKMVAATGALRLTQERSEEHTSELQSLMRISYAVFCLKKKNRTIETKVT